MLLILSEYYTHAAYTDQQLNASATGSIADYINSLQFSSLPSWLILSTSNRFDLWIDIAPTDFLQIEEISNNFRKFFGNYTEYKDSASVRYIIKLASGLLSEQIGETEIIRQIKKALATYKDKLDTDSELFRIISFSIQHSAKIRNRIGLEGIKKGIEGFCIKEIIDSASKDSLIVLLGNSERLDKIQKKLISNKFQNVITFTDQATFRSKIADSNSKNSCNILVTEEKLLDNDYKIFNLLIDLTAENYFHSFDCPAVVTLADLEQRMEEQNKNLRDKISGFDSYIDKLVIKFLNK